MYYNTYTRNVHARLSADRLSFFLLTTVDKHANIIVISIPECQDWFISVFIDVYLYRLALSS